MPGLGSTVACFLGYGIAKKAAKTGDKFGSGEIKGVAAPEAANNAVVGSSLIPLFTLGIPGSVAASLLVGAFIIHGITPGPLMFEEHGRAVYGIYGSMLIGNIATLVLGYVGIKLFIKVLQIQKQILYSIILFTCIVGAYIWRQIHSTCIQWHFLW
jgi:putative tricarboxylic transport membrane protein